MERTDSILQTDDGRRWPSGMSEATPRLERLAPPLELESEVLRSEVQGLESDLLDVLRTFASGPMAEYREQARTFVSDMRRAFLRVYRRLAVRARSEELSDLDRVLAVECAELATQFHDAVLGRSSRVVHEPWGVLEIAQDVDRVVGFLPEHVEAPLEPRSVVRQSGDGVVRIVRRWLLRVRRRKRMVELRELVHERVTSLLPELLEGQVSILIQAEVQLGARLRQLFDEIESALVDLEDESSASQLKERLEHLKVEVEDELAVAAREHEQQIFEALERLRAGIGHGVEKLHRALEVAGTFEGERPRFRKEVHARRLESLRARLRAAREVVGAGHGLTGMRFEFAAFRQHVEDGIEDFVEGLEADIKGRSFTQVERVASVLDKLIERLDAAPADKDLVQGWLRHDLEPLERTVQEALRASDQLEEQLLAEGATQPLIETLARIASGLTDRYEVPLQLLERSDWRLPEHPGVHDIPFASAVSSFVQRDVAPHLIERTAKAAEGLGPLRGALGDVERLVQYNPDQYGSELELEGTGSLGPAGIRDALATAARTHRESLSNLRATSESWSHDLGRDLRSALQERLGALYGRLREGEAHKLKPGRASIGAEGRSFLEEQGERASRAARDAYQRSGLSRIVRDFGRSTHARRARSRAELDELLSPPRFSQIPVYYRRLFAPQSHWAGDIVPGQPAAIARSRTVLQKAVSAGLRSVAIVGVDGAGRGAVVSAVMQGGSFASIRRLNLLRPTAVEELHKGLEGMTRDNLVVVTGLGYLLSAEPGGFAPLRTLARAVLDDDGRNAWLVEADELVWRYAGQVVPLDHVFMERVDVRALARQEIERAIFARHHLSGMKLRFVSEERQEDFASDGEGHRGRRGTLREQYFNDLHRRSGGLLQVALTLWLASLEGFEDEDTRVVVRAVPPSPRDALDQLPDHQIELLYLALRQGWIRPSCLAFVRREGRLEAEAQIRRMVHLGLLERATEDVFIVRRHLRGAAHRVLNDRGYA